MVMRLRGLFKEGSSLSLFMSDEELWKKKDGREVKVSKLYRAKQWNLIPLLPRRTLKRLVLLFIVGFCVYIFIASMHIDVHVRDLHLWPVHSVPPINGGDTATNQQPRPKPNDCDCNKDVSAVAARNYAGPIYLPTMSVTLKDMQPTSIGISGNLLFTAASLKSAARLLPMACQMSTGLRSDVHFALMGRSDIAVKTLRSINRIDDSCQIIFHDVRPSHATISTDRRLQSAVSLAVYQIQAQIHPQAVVMDGSKLEEDFFIKTMRQETRMNRIPLIELPHDATQKLQWLTRLDSVSLAAWNKIRIDIFIHAAQGTSGALIRLLRSLAAADYTSSSTPHLTIELPHVVAEPTKRFLEKFQWPPADAQNPNNERRLSIRHRIPRSSLTEEESSVRFLESFWPVDARYSHVLVLSPQVELAPNFFHYLKYSILEYTLSHTADRLWQTKLLGLSLDLPSSHLYFQTSFEPPASKNGEASSFLWQAPNSNAMLFLGSKWVELHGFVSRLLEAKHKLGSEGSASPPTLLTGKVVSKQFPSWLEHVVTLSRARGYFTLYPSRKMAEKLAAVHNEHYQAPEEYKNEVDRDSKSRHSGSEITLSTAPLLESLPGNGYLPRLEGLPLVLWNGELATMSNLDALNGQASEFATKFRAAVGGACEGWTLQELTPREDGSDLFCETKQP